MKGHKLLFFAVAAFVMVAGAVAAIVLFRDELASFLTSFAQKFNDKRKSIFKRCDCEEDYTDYADV